MNDCNERKTATFVHFECVRDCTVPGYQHGCSFRPLFVDSVVDPHVFRHAVLWSPTSRHVNFATNGAGAELLPGAREVGLGYDLLGFVVDLKTDRPQGSFVWMREYKSEAGRRNLTEGQLWGICRLAEVADCNHLNTIKQVECHGKPLTIRCDSIFSLSIKSLQFFQTSGVI